MCEDRHPEPKVRAGLWKFAGTAKALENGEMNAREILILDAGVVVVRYPNSSSESKLYHELARVFVEHFRAEVEQVSGIKDPYRKDRESLLKDTKALARLLRAGIPGAIDLTMEEFWWWLLTVLDVHKPIVDHFGR